MAKPNLVSVLQSFSDLSQRALAIALVNGGQVFPGVNSVQGSGLRVNISTLNKLERQGYLSHRLSGEGGAMFSLTVEGRTNAPDARAMLVKLTQPSETT